MHGPSIDSYRFTLHILLLWQVTWIEYGVIDYYAIVNCTLPSFIIKAENWGVAASNPYCENGAYLSVNVDDDPNSTGPQEKYFMDGESFSFEVFNPNDGANISQYDIMFSVRCTADYTLKLSKMTIEC